MGQAENPGNRPAPSGQTPLTDPLSGALKSRKGLRFIIRLVRSRTVRHQSFRAASRTQGRHAGLCVPGESLPQRLTGPLPCRKQSAKNKRISSIRHLRADLRSVHIATTSTACPIDRRTSPISLHFCSQLQHPYKNFVAGKAYGPMCGCSIPTAPACPRTSVARPKDRRPLPLAAHRKRRPVQKSIQLNLRGLPPI